MAHIVTDMIRSRVQLARDKLWETAISNRMEWSARTLTANWLDRKLSGLPVKPFTREEAIVSLNNGDYWDYCRKTYLNNVLKLCDVIDCAKDNGLPLKLTSVEVALLREYI